MFNDRLTSETYGGPPQIDLELELWILWLELYPNILDLLSQYQSNCNLQSEVIIAVRFAHDL